MKKQLIAFLLFNLFTITYLYAQDSIVYYKNVIKKRQNNPKYYNMLSYKYAGIKKDSCYYFAQKAGELAIKQKNNVEFALSLLNIGRSKSEIEEPEIELEYYAKALKILLKTKNYYQISRVYNTIGVFYFRTLEFNKAIENYKIAIEIQKKHKIDLNLGSLYSNISGALINLGEYKKALQYIDSAGLVSAKLKNTGLISYIIANKAYIYIMQKKFKEAKTLLDSSLKIIKTNNEIFKFQAVYNLLTIYYIETNNFEIAHKYADSVYFEAKKHKTGSYFLVSYRAYYLMYEKFAKFDKAFKYFKQYHNLKDSIFEKEKYKILTEIRTKFNSEINEQKIIILDKQNKIDKYKIKYQKNWIWVLSLGVVILSTLMGIILFQKRAKFLINKKLVEKNIQQITQSKTVFVDNTEYDNVDIENIKYNSSNLTIEQKEEINAQILYLFENDKIYLNPDCSITTLGEKLGTNKTYISQVINEKFENNFKTILKEYRIKEAMSLLLDKKNENITIEAISLMTGFKSKSVFNNSFKSFTGVTPSFFLKQKK